MYVTMPNGYKVFLDNSLSNYDDRLQEVEDHILKYNDDQWSNYFEDAWLRETSISGVSRNFTRDILDKAATFLLLGQYRDSNVMTIRKIKSTSDKEIPMSNTFVNVYNLVYAGKDSDDDMNLTCSPELIPDVSPKKEIYAMTDQEIEKEKKKARKSKKKWKQTQTYKLNRLYTTPEVKTYRVKPVKDENGKSIKDVSGNIILNAIDVTIGGHKGIIEPTNKTFNVPSYVAKWCMVDVDGNFSFMDKNYVVSDKRYEVYNKAQVGNNGELNDFSNKADMEKILCIYAPNHGLLFYDEKAEPINKTSIGEIS